MLSRSVLLACSKKLATVPFVSRTSSIAVRFNSTTAVPNTSSIKSNVSPSQPSTFKPNPLVESLYECINTEYKEFSPFFEDVSKIIDNASKRDVSTANRSMISCGAKLLNKIDEIKSNANIDVPSSILYKEIITLLKENRLMNISHFNKYIQSMINDKKYLNALTFWIDNASYFKSNERCFVDKRGNSQSDYYLNGLTVYLLSLIENKESKIDEEFINLIFNDSFKAPVYSKLEYFIGRFDLSKDDRAKILKFYKDFKKSATPFDINSAESLKGIRLASVSGKLVHLENTISNNLLEYKGKESEIKPSTIAHYMKYLNNSKLYSKSIELFKYCKDNNIDIDIGIWNQFLNSYTKVKIDNSKSVVESIWKLINTEIKPNSESYSIYIQYLLKNKELNEVGDLIRFLKEEKPDLLNSDLKCSIVDYLIDSKKLDAGLQLFNFYTQEKSFQPNIITLNKLLSSVIYSKNFDEASKILNDILTNKYDLKPDQGTYQIIIDFILKSSIRSKLSAFEIFEKIIQIQKEMKSNNMEFNNVTLMTILINLSKNKNTHSIGIRLLTELESSGFKLNQIGYSGIITSLADNNDMDNAVLYYNKAIKNGIKPSAFLYNSIFKGYSRSNDVRKTREFMKQVKSLIKENPDNVALLPNTFTFYFLLGQGISSNDSSFIKEILDLLTESNCDISLQLSKTIRYLQSQGYEIPSSIEARLKNE